MLKFAIVGVGGLGKLHLRNAVHLQGKRGDIQLTALCDIEPSRFTEEIATNLDKDASSVDVSPYKLYNDAKEMLEKEELDFIISAVPTYLHEEIAVMAFENGLHVFTEKPMAINLLECKRMLNKAKETDRILMVGHCLRYSPEYKKLKEYIENNEFGRVIRAEFSRYSLTPKWSWQNWMMNFDKSGGAALDLHVHDVDYINWVFGKPISVLSTATNETTKLDSIFTIYEYEDKLVMSAGDWGLTDSYPFTPSFLVRFEKAVVEMKNGVMKVFPEGEKERVVEFPAQDAYIEELNDFVNCIKENKEPRTASARSVLDSMEIAFAEMQSAVKGERVYV